MTVPVGRAMVQVRADSGSLPGMPEAAVGDRPIRADQQKRQRVADHGHVDQDEAAGRDAGED